MIRFQVMDDAAPNTSSPTDPRQQARQCYAEIAQVLAKHACRIVPLLTQPESVGADGSAVLIRATFAVVAEDA